MEVCASACEDGCLVEVLVGRNDRGARDSMFSRLVRPRHIKESSSYFNLSLILFPYNYI